MTDEAIKRLEEIRALANATDTVWLISQLEAEAKEVERLSEGAAQNQAYIGTLAIDVAKARAERDKQRRHRKWALKRARDNCAFDADLDAVLQKVRADCDKLAQRAKVLEEMLADAEGAVHWGAEQAGSHRVSPQGIEMFQETAARLQKARAALEEKP